MACLFLSELNCIFHWYAHFSINLISGFKISVETCSSYTTENEEVSSANNLTSETLLHVRYISSTSSKICPVFCLTHNFVVIFKNTFFYLP